MVVCLRCCAIIIMLSVSYIFRENWVSFLYYCAVLSCAQIIQYIMARWSYSFLCTLHYLIIIIIQTICRYGTSKMLVSYILSSACLSHLCQLSYAVYGDVYMRLTHVSCDDFEDTCTLYYRHQIGSMNHSPLFRAGAWNSGTYDVCLCMLSNN